MLRGPASKIDSGRSDETCFWDFSNCFFAGAFRIPFLRILPIQTITAAHLFPPKLPRSDGPADESKSASIAERNAHFSTHRLPQTPRSSPPQRNVNKVTSVHQTRPPGRMCSHVGGHSCRAALFPGDAIFSRSIFSCKQTTWTACWAQPPGTANASPITPARRPKLKSEW
jgi:hypothetical protein